MTDDTDLDFLLVPEILMIVHLARNEGIGTSLDGIGQQERARTATKCHLADGAAQQFIGVSAAHAEALLHMEHKLFSGKRSGELPHNAITTRNTVHLLLLTEETQARQPQFFGHAIVDTATRAVHVGVHRGDNHIVLDGFHHRALHVVGTSDSGEFTKDERMVRNYQITATPNGLINHGLGHVKTQ